MIDAALTDARRLALSVVAAVMEPPPPPDLEAWATENIRFGRESPVPGPYRAENFPFFARPLECLSPDHPARIVTVVASAQIGKTTMAQIFVAGSMSLDPCHMLYTHPTHDNALRWARGKWSQMRRQSLALRRVFGEARSRDARDTTLYQETRDGQGSLQISGANSAASLSMISPSRQVQDDLAKWEPNSGGDPERQADNRSAAWDWAKILKLSTPLFADTCRITRAFRAGTQERFHVPCPHCSHMQPLEWETFQLNIDPADPDAAHFNCMACGEAIEHRHKLSIVARGCWVADNPRAPEPSFHMWRAYAPTRDWASIAREWLAAEGDPLAEQTFYNDVLGLPYERASEAPPWEAIRDRAREAGHDRGRIPAGALIIGVGIDCQGDRTEVHVKGFGRDLQRWTIDYLVIPHHIADEACHQALDTLLGATWPDEFGNRRGIDMLAIDGNAYTRDVFGWARRHPWTRVIVVRGAKSDQAPELALTRTERRPDGQVRKAQRRFYNVNVSKLKSSFYQHLAKADPLARGFCGYPKGLGDEFFIQMTAEVRVTDKDRHGYPRSYWKLPAGVRNEVLDTEIYAEAAAIRCGWYTMISEAWDQLRAERERPAERAQSDLFDPDLSRAAAHPSPAPAPTPAAAAPARRRVVRSGYMN